MTKTRPNFAGTEKAAILREHRVERGPIFDVCEKRGLQPTLICRRTTSGTAQQGNKATRQQGNKAKKGK